MVATQSLGKHSQPGPSLISSYAQDRVARPVQSYLRVTPRRAAYRGITGP